MAENTKLQSVEPDIAQLGNDWLKSYGIDYKLEQASLNTEIDNALAEYASKSGGNGGNRPDAKAILQDKNFKFYPILIEYKGYKDKLVKLDSEGNVDNKSKENKSNIKNIQEYAVNGAVHYANALLHYTSYTDIIAIGMTGFKDKLGKLQHSIGVYYVSKSNFGIGQKVGEYTDFSFLKKENFDSFIEKVNNLQLTAEEIDRLKEKRDDEIIKSLKKLNIDIYKNEKGLGENERVYLVAATIMATLGVPNKVAPLDYSELKSSSEMGDRDGDIILRKIEAFLATRDLPNDKRDLIVSTLKNTLISENINKSENGESQLKRVFKNIVDNIGIYYKTGISSDFTGKLFNEMYNWLGFSQDTLNDVVLTPSYVATLLVKLCRVNYNSYVWDFATGSAGLLVAAMNEMIKDARENIKSPEELDKKEREIKAEHLLGIEKLSSIYMLAILNMIIMGDGSSNIINGDSLRDFDGCYGFGEKHKKKEKFPADAFVLNPPYSADGNGMIFVEKALSQMNKGYAAIIIQDTAGSGKAVEYNQRILQHNTLIASIKMPADLFAGKSKVKSYIYVFKVGEKHEKDEVVKFIDFSNDGYKRTTRKVAKKNLEDINKAKERYQEIVNLVRFGKSKLRIFTEKEYYEGHIDPNNGSDWNQSAPIDITPKKEDFDKTVSDYLRWKISTLIKDNQCDKVSLNNRLRKLEESFKLSGGNFIRCKLKQLFQIKGNPQLNKESFVFSDNGVYPYFTRTVSNNGIHGYVEYLDDKHKIPGNTIAVGLLQMQFFYMEKDFYAGQFTKTLYPKMPKFNEDIALYFIVMLNKLQNLFQSMLVRHFESTFYNEEVIVPTKNGQIDFNYIEEYIGIWKEESIQSLRNYVRF